ncbi:6,7-dimethyl-8-ribityllumazine synthase [Pyruvatibacter mobilis]|uniref:6,7-dimethyl-8-ribityllumazine synthase n=1 Tax=Pyruvatibacter mobilis TaxID=1712261 RepID=UPI003BAF68EF
MSNKAPHILIIEARFYPELTDEMARGAIAEIEAQGGTYERMEVPGVLEIPAAVAYALRTMQVTGRQKHYDGFVTLGCVIRGETAHFDIVAFESARALMDLSVKHALALGNGIQTVENSDQAWARAKVDDKNKGGGAAAAALAMIAHKRAMKVDGL